MGFFNTYPALEGTHAFLSPSQNAWLRYDEDKLIERFRNHTAAARGTKLHELAKDLILLGQKLPRTQQTLNRYVNDAIAFRMTPEQTLFYSVNCFGTADAIRFDEKKMDFTIHDLKTGVTKVSFDQLIVYAALFCLEYEYRPADIDIVLRIYQNDEVMEFIPELDTVSHYMDKIRISDKILNSLKAEEIL